MSGAESAGALLKPPGACGAAIGKLLHWYYRLFVSWQHTGAVLETIGANRLVVLPGVLNPRLMRTGEFFASQLNARVLSPDTAVLDMGAGSGVCTVAAARFSRQVVAVDINPEAVRCTRINTLLNRVDHRVEVLQGDLFAPLADRKFDLILFNPPFLQRTPRDDADRAWAATDVAERFAARLREHLRPGGCALVLLSSFGSAGKYLAHFRRHGLTVSVLARRRFVNESLAIFRLTA